MKLPDSKTLATWIKHDWNVLMTSEKGVGKSAIITEAFNRAFGRMGTDWLYFSAGTLDPWVDFVGIPRVCQGPILRPVLNANGSGFEQSEDGQPIMREQMSEYLELVRPKAFASHQVKAIFFDEFNRAPAKVLNAVMELIQFKSINGHAFPNLRVVWAAINPDDEEKTYAVETMDPAHRDRFHIQIEIDSTPDRAYFEAKYKDHAAPALEWWDSLKASERKLVSPRRLDYALEVFTKGGNIKHVLNPNTNPQKLADRLKVGPIRDELRRMKAGNLRDEARAKLANSNFFSGARDFIFNADHFDFFVPLLPPELIAEHVTPTTLKRFDNLIAAGDQVIAGVFRSIYASPSADKSLRPLLPQLISRIDAAQRKAAIDGGASPFQAAAERYANAEESRNSTTFTRLASLTELRETIRHHGPTAKDEDFKAVMEILNSWAIRSQSSTINSADIYVQGILPWIKPFCEANRNMVKSTYPEICTKCKTLASL